METPTDYTGDPLTILGTEEVGGDTILCHVKDSTGYEFDRFFYKITIEPKLDVPESTITYWELNLYAESYRINWQDDHSFTITVYNQDEYRKGDTIIEAVNQSFLLLYLSVIVVCIVLYRQKSRKI